MRCSDVRNENVIATEGGRKGGKKKSLTTWLINKPSDFVRTDRICAKF